MVVTKLCRKEASGAWYSYIGSRHWGLGMLWPTWTFILFISFKLSRFGPRNAEAVRRSVVRKLIAYLGHLRSACRPIRFVLERWVSTVVICLSLIYGQKLLIVVQVIRIQEGGSHNLSCLQGSFACSFEKSLFEWASVMVRLISIGEYAPMQKIDHWNKDMNLLVVGFNVHVNVCFCYIIKGAKFQWENNLARVVFGIFKDLRITLVLQYAVTSSYFVIVGWLKNLNSS